MTQTLFRIFVLERYRLRTKILELPSITLIKFGWMNAAAFGKGCTLGPYVLKLQCSTPRSFASLLLLVRHKSQPLCTKGHSPSLPLRSQASVRHFHTRRYKGAVSLSNTKQACSSASSSSSPSETPLCPVSQPQLVEAPGSLPGSH